MAITRTQQFKQMLKKGGRTGFFTAGLALGDEISPGTAASSSRDGPRGRGGPPGIDTSPPVNPQVNKLKEAVNKFEKEKVEERLEKFRRLGSSKRKFENFISKVSPIAMFASRFGPLNTKDFFLENYLSSKNAPMTKEQFSLLSPEEQEAEYDKYEKGRLSGVIDAYGNLLPQGGGGDGITKIIPMDTAFDQESSDMDQESEEDDKDLRRLVFRANGGRIGFFTAGLAAGDEISPGTAASSSRDGPRGRGDGPSGPSTTGGGGGVTSIIKEKPPVNIVKEKSNIQKIMDIFGLSDDNDPKSVSLGTGLAEKAKQDIIKDKEIKAQGMSEAEAELIAQGLLPAKAEGGRIGLMGGGMPYEGGIMDLESARQMYGLGKLVKKVTRSVKKIAKSPIGKAALLYAGTAGLGSIGSGLTGFARFAPSNFMSNVGRIGSFITGGKINPLNAVNEVALTGKQNIFQKIIGGIPGGITTAIAGTSLLAGLLTAQQEEEAQELSRGEGIDIEEARRMILQAGTSKDRRALAFRAEGGPAEGKEPVAKKTMPLLDMGGKEMDLRAEGGFVPIGRMEKADDVPARLSKNEFVFTADAVRNAGDGNVDKGAEVMYNMMKNLEAGGDVSEESQGLEGARKMFQTSQRLEEVI